MMIIRSKAELEFVVEKDSGLIPTENDFIGSAKKRLSALEQLIIDDCLDEELMGLMFDYLFGKGNIIKNKGLPENRSIRPDILIPQIRTVFEFDGYLHYTRSATIEKDKFKNSEYAKYGYKVHRFPYFIQPSVRLLCKMLPDIFDKTLNTICFTYLNGFVYPDLVVPADFCETGLIQFSKDLEYFSEERHQIIDTLKMQRDIRGSALCVVPPSMIRLLKGEPASEESHKAYYFMKILLDKKEVDWSPLSKSAISEAYAQKPTHEVVSDGFYAKYKFLGGEKDRTEFDLIVKKFTYITIDSFVNGCGVTRDRSMTVASKALGSRAEAERVFVSLDSVRSYT